MVSEGNDREIAPYFRSGHNTSRYSDGPYLDDLNVMSNGQYAEELVRSALEANVEVPELSNITTAQVETLLAETPDYSLEVIPMELQALAKEIRQLRVMKRFNRNNPKVVRGNPFERVA